LKNLAIPTAYTPYSNEVKICNSHGMKFKPIGFLIKDFSEVNCVAQLMGLYQRLASEGGKDK